MGCYTVIVAPVFPLFRLELKKRGVWLHYGGRQVKVESTVPSSVAYTGTIGNRKGNWDTKY